MDEAALSEWAEISDSLLRGIVHALNNRVTALSAFAELSGLRDTEFTAAEVLPGELSRLQLVNRHLRLLVGEDLTATGEEPASVLEDAMSLHASHPRLPAIRRDLVREGPQMPVRVPRWALLRLFVTIVESGARAAERAGAGSMVLRLTGDERSVVIQVDGVTLSPYTIAMARLCGAIEGTAHGDTLVRLPSLLELRRLDREARAEVGSR